MKRKPPKTGVVKGKTKATSEQWISLRNAKMGACRVCQSTRCTLHHLLGGNLRSDVSANLISLCGNGSMGCHGIYTTRGNGTSFDGRKRSWFDVAFAIRKSLRDDELAYVVDVVGEDGLERRYPAGPTADPSQKDTFHKP